MSESTRIKVFQYQGQSFPIPFQLAEVDGEKVAVAFAQDIGRFFYDTDDERQAAKQINTTADRHPEIFNQPGIRTDLKRRSLDGRLRNAWAYTKRGVMALGMKVRSDRGAAFVLWAAEVMEKLLSGILAPTKPASAIDLIIESAKQLKMVEQRQAAIEIEQRRQGEDLYEVTQAVKDVEHKVNSRLKRSTIADDEVTSKAIAKLVGWYSQSGRLHGSAVARVAKDRGFIRRGLARIADYWDESAGWVSSLAFTQEGVKAFEREVDEPFKSHESFAVPLGCGTLMHVYRKRKVA